MSSNAKVGHSTKKRDGGVFFTLLVIGFMDVKIT